MISKRMHWQFTAKRFWLYVYAVLCFSPDIEAADDTDRVRYALHQLQDALNQKDTPKLELLLADIPGTVPKRELASMYIEGVGQARHTPKDPSGFSVLLSEGRPDRIDALQTKRGEQWITSGVYRVWMSDSGSRIRGHVDFVKQQGQWKWLVPLNVAGPAPSYGYDLSSPTKAFLTLRLVANPVGDGVPDIYALYALIDEHQKTGVTLDQYAETLKERQSKPKWKRVESVGQQDTLEAEPLPAEDGKQKCRVWRLDEKGKRTTFELFVKEGDEWKWLPDPKCIWYPSKAEDDPKE